LFAIFYLINLIFNSFANIQNKNPKKQIFFDKNANNAQNIQIQGRYADS